MTLTPKLAGLDIAYAGEWPYEDNLVFNLKNRCENEILDNNEKYAV